MMHHAPKVESPTKTAERIENSWKFPPLRECTLAVPRLSSLSQGKYERKMKKEKGERFYGKIKLTAL